MEEQSAVWDEYLVYENDDKQTKKVRGRIVANGLGIHEDRPGVWGIDHIPSYYIMSEFSSFDEAKKVADEIKTLINWSQKDAVQLISKCEEFKNHLSAVKQAAQSGKDLPMIDQQLAYQLVFLTTPEISKNWENFRSAWSELQAMVGLDNIKEQIEKMLGQIRGRMKNRGKVEEKSASMHMVFAGPPGTGKTEVARVMGKLLHALNRLPSNKCVEVDRSNIVGSAIGQTAEQMSAIVQEALGGVLFIDEAYALAKQDSPMDFGQEAVDILIKSMEDNREDLVVILAGYAAPMERLLEMNEGFNSRIRYRFVFQDYTPVQLTEIGIRILEKRGYKWDEEVREALKKAIEGRCSEGVYKDNARGVRNMADDIIDELNLRVGKTDVEDTVRLVVEDVKRAAADKNASADAQGLAEIREEALKELENLIGMDELKAEVKRLLIHVALEKRRFEEGLSTVKPRLHMMFTGPAGTGKTSVARVMGKFLKGSGLLSSGHFVKASRAELVGGYQGQTATRVKATVKSALGGVLFVDEAYTLVNSENDSFGIEAVDQLIDWMEARKDEFVVIIAGYEDKIDELLKSNEGFRSRFAHTFVFPDYTAEDIVKIARIHLRKNHLAPTEEAEQALAEEILRYGEERGAFDGNGRWAGNLADKIKSVQGERLVLGNINELTKEELTTVFESDVRQGIKLMK